MDYTWQHYELAKDLWVVVNPNHSSKEYELFIRDLLEFMGL